MLNPGNIKSTSLTYPHRYRKRFIFLLFITQRIKNNLAKCKLYMLSLVSVDKEMKNSI